jgi:succinoglycan biosynthesis transport protein ExoP
LYDRLTSLLQNVDISRNIDQDTLAILDHATPSTRSYTEAKTMIIHSIFIGLGLGLGIVFLIAIRDDRFISIGEVTERFGDNVVGQVPEIPEFSTMKSLSLLEENDDRHMYAESYRNLRSALLYLGVEGKAAQGFACHQRRAKRGQVHDCHQPCPNAGPGRRQGSA